VIEKMESMIEAWRNAYESDPDVSQDTIARAVGCSQRTVSKYAMRNGWKVRNGGTRRTKAERQADGRFVAIASLAPTPVVWAPVPSIWAWAKQLAEVQA
jgi:hypothetical protein